MDTLEQLKAIEPLYLYILIFICSFVFVITWFFDSKTHGRLIEDIDVKELQTHRLILIPSVLAEISIVLMYWINPWYLLPFFLAFYLTRTIQEFIDELKWHTGRCSNQESYFHLIMWTSVHAKLMIMFIWGFFFQFEGILQIPLLLHILMAIVFGLMGLLSLIEWKR